MSLPAGFVLESSPVYKRTCFIFLSQLLRWSCVTEGSSVVFSAPLDLLTWLGLISLVQIGFFIFSLKYLYLNCDFFGRSVFSPSL